MAISVLNTQTGVDLQTPAGVSITPSAGSNRFLALIGTGYRTTGTTRSVSDVKLNAVSSDHDSTTSNSGSFHPFISGWLDASISTGDFGSIVWAVTDDMTHKGYGCALELAGVHQTLFLGGTDSALQASGTSHSTGAITVATGDILLVSVIKSSSTDFTGFDGTGFTVAMSATPTMGASARLVKCYYKIIESDGTETLTWTWSGTTACATHCIVLHPAGASAAPILMGQACF